MSSNKKRFCHVGLDLVPSSGGMPKSIQQFQQALNGTVISFSNPEKLDAEGSAFPGIHHVKCTKGPMGRGYSYATKQELMAADRLIEQCDVITCHVMLRYHANWVISRAAKRNIPYWVVLHGQLDPYVFTYRAFIKKLWLKIFGQRMLNGAQHVIFSTEAEKNKASWFYSGPNIKVVNWPVDRIETKQSEIVRIAERTAWGIPNQAKVLLYLGRLHVMKQVMQTLEAVAACQDPNLWLVIAGPDDTYTAEDCRAYARKLNIGDRVLVLGAVDRARRDRIFQAVDGFISLSKRENFGFTTAEAAAAGLPLILSPGNDLSPEFRKIGAGWILNDDSIEGAINALQGFSSAPNTKFREMGNRGKSYVENTLSWDRFSNSISKL